MTKEQDLPVSLIIRNRMKDAKHRFFANDNVSEFIEPGELDALQNELTEKFSGVLQSMLIDTEHDPNSKGTAKRMAKMYLHEIFRGRYYPSPPITAFPNERKKEIIASDEERPAYTWTGLLVVPAEIRSTCSHHHMQVEGLAYIGVLPGEKVIGLSKYVRIAQHVARRGTLQEQLAVDILKKVQEATGTDDVAVYISSTHGCMSCRGVAANHAFVSNAELGGRFFTVQPLREEYYRHIERLEAIRLTGAV